MFLHFDHYDLVDGMVDMTKNRCTIRYRNLTMNSALNNVILKNSSLKSRDCFEAILPRTTSKTLGINEKLKKYILCIFYLHLSLKICNYIYIPKDDKKI